MKRELRILLIVAFVLIAVGCNIVQRRSTTESYRISGELLESTRISLRTLCDNGVFTPVECEKHKVSYEQAASKFLQAGEMLKQAARANRAMDDILEGIKRDIRRVE